jgi:hypothetical protein
VLFSQLSTDGSSIDPGSVLFWGSNIYPAMFEITGEIPEPLFDKTRRLGRPQRMASLDWKSDTAATVIHPLLKGNG